ncbi:hypothetical protein ABRY97_07255 [Castellaniella ginsengisoli]|uniref:Uncharacterized protein n=1 Tax=Castellaniella ginsengisoli TaxID=546114 RepID=A0AB39F667_9BURK
MFLPRPGPAGLARAAAHPMPRHASACRACSRGRQRGAGAAGFLLAAIPILTLGLGGVEAAHWSGLRQTLSLALMESARAGAVRQASPQAIAQAFEHGLRMVYPDPDAAGRALRTRRTTLGIPWHIRIVRPSPAAFLDHADPDLLTPRDHPGQALIRNDYQPLQQARRLAQGWPAGRGPRSGLTIQEANTLVLDLWWPHRPLVPGTALLLRALAPLAADPVQARLMAAGYLPFRRRAGIAMHSHPAAWPDLADGRVTHEAMPQGWLAAIPAQGGTAGPLEAAVPAAGRTPGEAAPAGPSPAPQPPGAQEAPGANATARDEGMEADAGPGAAACEPAP